MPTNIHATARTEIVMRHLIDPRDFTLQELDTLLRLGKDVSENPQKYSDICHKKILATLFFEPSTRTRLSFESAMLRMGGKVLGFSSADTSSAAKGESIEDTVRMISGYSDICVIRHPFEGAPKRASMFAGVPIVNAGDGGHQHPTQTLTDLLTILGRKNRLDNLKIGFCGDLKYGRTVHSLMGAMSRYKNNTFVLISPKELRAPQRYIDEATQAGTVCKECLTLEEGMGELDILYMTRVQKERFVDTKEYDRLKDFYILDAQKMALAPQDMAVLHPLPRVNEIAQEVDTDGRAAYFEQAQNGVYVRMALIITLLNLDKNSAINAQPHWGQAEIISGEPCKNKRCISNAQEATAAEYTVNSKGALSCIYCEREA